MEKDFLENFNEHCKDNKQDFKLLFDSIANLKDNHLAHLQTTVTEIKINQSWLLKYFWLISSVTITTLIASILTLIFK
jgi:hypothetical protein